MRATSVLPWLALPALAGAQPGAQPGAKPAVAVAGAFFALSVADVDASARWYAEKLGLAVVMRVPRRDGAAVTVLEGGGLTVELVARDGAVPLGARGVRDPIQVHGIFKVGAVAADYDATLAALRARGVPVAMGPFPATATQRANFVVRDDAGNMLQFFGGYAGRAR